MRSIVPRLIALGAAAAAAAVLPNWEPTYLANKSTIFMPCNNSGLFSAEFAARWGIADFDWSNGKQLWANTKPMDCEEMLVEQVQKIHAVDPTTRTFVYRNLVKALPWFSSVREKLDDPAYAGFFLRFKSGGYFPNGTYHVPACTGDKCSVFYHDQEQTPHHPHGDGSCKDQCDCGTQPCGEYLWDHRNGTMLRDFLVNEFVMGPTGMGAPGVSGFYFDDGWTTSPEPIEPWMPKDGFCSHNSFGGPTEEDRWCIEDTGLDAADVQSMHSEWSATVAAAQAALHAAGGFTWQMFKTLPPPTDTATCKSFFEASCKPGSETNGSAVIMPWTLGGKDELSKLAQPDVDMASFLLARGPFAWIGYGWVGCATNSEPGNGKGVYQLPQSTQVDYGVPRGICSEASPGVFTREWSKATVSMDCASMKPTITMK